MLPLVTPETSTKLSADSDQLLEQHMASIIRLAMDLSVYVEVGSDFSEFVELCRATRGKGEVSPAFNPAKTRVNEQTGMWMTGRRANGEIVYAQAVKLLPLEDRSLQHYLETSLGDIRIGGMAVDVANSPIALCDAAAQVQGHVTYHGEVWAKGGPDGVRGGSLTILLSRLILIMAYLRWKPDFMIGIQAIKTCCRGLSVRQGYARNQPGFVKWKIDGQQDPIEGWLVWMSREEAAYNLAVPPSRFYDVFETKAQAGPAMPLARSTG